MNGTQWSELKPFGGLLQSSSENTLPPPTPELRDRLLRDRVLVFRGFESCETSAQLADYAAQWGPILEWDFGAVFEVLEHADPQNYLFTNGSVPYHWDGAFARQVPWLQVFQCVESPSGRATESDGFAGGGETLFCDTHRVWQSAPEELQQRWRAIQVQYATAKVAHYGGSITASVVDTHPLTGEHVIRYNEPPRDDTSDLNTPEILPVGMDEAERQSFMDDMRARLYEPDAVYAHRWQAGDFVIADNFVLLHGRNPYDKAGKRHLRRVHVLQ